MQVSYPRMRAQLRESNLEKEALLHLVPSAPLVAQCLIWLCSAHLVTQCTPCTPVLTSPSCKDTVGRPRHWSHLDRLCCPVWPDPGDPGCLEAVFWGYPDFSWAKLHWGTTGPNSYSSVFPTLSVRNSGILPNRNQQPHNQVTRYSGPVFLLEKGIGKGQWAGRGRLQTVGGYGLGRGGLGDLWPYGPERWRGVVFHNGTPLSH